MPKITRDHVGLAFDMRGCPNRCRHCYLGPGGSITLSEQDLRWGVSQFRDAIARGDTAIKTLSVATWFREPDFGDYRHLYDLEAELSDGEPSRYELLSVWRLAHDASYAPWAKSVGPGTCQISFFGMRETTDWFCRRKGAFDDALAATERLLAAGMKPRWQLFLTTRLLPELDDLLALVEARRLRERVRELGGEFQIFMHPPGPDYEGRKIEGLRPTVAQVADLPETILAPSRKHFGRDVLWQTEEALYAEIIQGGEVTLEEELPETLWFFVCGNWDVFTNVGTLEPWYCLGNLKRDSVGSMVARFEDDGALGLRVQFRESPADLAERYGDPTGQKVYSSKADLLSLYGGRYCEEEWDRV
jgi:hypothetical protein